MTLQEIADYAMDYLDSKGIAADYEITSSDKVKVYFDGIYFDGNLLEFHEIATKSGIKTWLDAFI